jgi:hypothetical protein
MFSELAETYKAEFEKRDNGQRVNNPAANWQKVTAEVAALDSRNAGQGYMVYSMQRAMGDTHEDAIAYVIKNVIWR